MSLNEQVLQKLQKILARADVSRGATQAEVEIAMQKAQALALEHNIDLSTVTTDGEVKVNAIETDSTAVNISTKYERTYHLEILNVLAWCFDVRTITSSYWTHQAQKVITKITFVGEKTDVVIATYCWSYLEALFPKCWSEYSKQTGAKGWVSERSFYKGLAIGIWSSNKRQKDEMKKDDANRYALVVADKKALVDAKTAEMFPNMRDNRAHQKRSDEWAQRSGFQRGQSIKLNGGLTAGETQARIS